MIFEYHEVPQVVVEEALETVPAEINRESVRIWLSQIITSWEGVRPAFFDKLRSQD